MPLKSAIKTDTGNRNRSVKISDRIEMPETGSRADHGSGHDSGGGDSAASTSMPLRTNTSGSDSSSDDDEEAEESSGKVTTKAGYEIDRKSAGNLKRTKEEVAADPDNENNFGYTDRRVIRIAHMFYVRTDSYLCGSYRRKTEETLRTAWRTNHPGQYTTRRRQSGHSVSRLSRSHQNGLLRGGHQSERKRQQSGR